METVSGLRSSGSRVCRHPLVNLRQDWAAERLKESEGRTLEQQLQRLDIRLGVGLGAKKERERIVAKMAIKTMVNFVAENQKSESTNDTKETVKSSEREKIVEKKNAKKIY